MENQEVKVKQVAPHWRELVKIKPYFTVVRPFYSEREKNYRVKVLNQNDDVVESEIFENKECAESFYRILLAKYKGK